MSFSSKQTRARGFTLVEALVALLALSIGLLGIAGMQLTGMRANMTAAWRTQATYLGYDILDRMRANKNHILEYEIGTGAAPVDASLTSLDLQAWKKNLAATLPSGNGTVDVNGNDVTIVVSWKEERDTAKPAVEFTMRSRM